MSDTRNHIYVYDDESHKIIVIDGETGEEVRQKEDRVSALLGHFRERGEEEKLRKFAVWCAHQTNEKIKPIQAKMFDLAEKAIYDKATRKQLRQLYDETEGTAIATDTVGLQHGSSSAPAFLASRECINPDAFSGAVQAARFHRLWAEMKEAEEESPYLKEVEVGVSQAAVIKTEQTQVDYLLDLMG